MPTKLPRCFFTVNIDGMPLGTVIFELCADICPKTCENFMSLCTGEKGHGSQGKLLSYKGSGFHRIVKNFMIQGGDFTHGTGVGGESIFGGVFPDENFILKHDQKYLLSMANRGPNTNGSQFFITTAVCPHLDNSHVVFGHVIEGERYLDQIEISTVDADHKPFADIRIVDCGVMPGYGREESPAPVVPEPAPVPLVLPTPIIPAPPVPPVAAVAPSNTIPLLHDAAPVQVEPVKEEKKKKKKKKKSSSDESDSSSSGSDSSESSDSDDSSDSDSGNKKLKTKKKKLLRIKKKLDKIAKKKKLKKSRAKKLKRVEEKLKKIDKILTGAKLTSEDDSEKEEMKKSFLYRSSVSPPKKKKLKKEKPAKKETKVLDDAFFAKRGKVAGAFMAPISQLHGLGVEEFSQTGPIDHITAIVNRTKTNVGPGVGGLEKAKKLGVNKVVIPTPKAGNIVVNPTDEKKAAAKPVKKKTQKKKASKKAESSSSDDSSDPSSSESESDSSEEEKKRKKKKKKSVAKEEKEEIKPKRTSSKVRKSSSTSLKPAKKKVTTPVKKIPKVKTKAKPKSVSKSPTVSRSPSRSITKSRSRSRSRSKSPVRPAKKDRGSSRRDRDRKKRSRSRSRSHDRRRRRSRSGSRRKHDRDSRRSRRRSRSRSSSSSGTDEDRYSGIMRSRGSRGRNQGHWRGRGRGNYNPNFNRNNWDPNYKQKPRLYNSHSGFAPRSVWDKNKREDQNKDKSPSRYSSSKRRSVDREGRNEEKKQGDKNTTCYMDDVEDRQPVKPKTGMRSKWSEDDDDSVKISTGTAKTDPKQDTQEFPYPNAVESKDGKADNLLTEYNSPKINFS